MMRKKQRPAYWPVFEGFHFSENNAVSVEEKRVDIIMDVVVVVVIEGELLVEFKGGGGDMSIMQMK